MGDFRPWGVLFALLYPPFRYLSSFFLSATGVCVGCFPLQLQTPRFLSLLIFTRHGSPSDRLFFFLQRELGFYFFFSVRPVFLAQNPPSCFFPLFVQVTPALGFSVVPVPFPPFRFFFFEPRDPQWKGPGPTLFLDLVGMNSFSPLIRFFFTPNYVGL